jgi:hypothetical protein
MVRVVWVVRVMRMVRVVWVVRMVPVCGRRRRERLIRLAAARAVPAHVAAQVAA